MPSIPLRDDIIPIATVQWPESDGGGTSEVGLADGLYILDGFAPMEDPALLATLDNEGAVTWATHAVRDWYFNAGREPERPVAGPPGALRIGGLASALVVLGYVLAAWSCFYLGAIFLLGEDSVLTVAGALWQVATYPYVLPALAFSWTADILISNAGQSSENGKAIVIAGYRFIHGPLVTAAFVLASAIGVASVLL